MDWTEKRVAIVERQLVRKTDSLGLFMFLQTDLRGGTLYLSRTELNDTNYHQLGEFIR